MVQAVSGWKPGPLRFVPDASVLQQLRVIRGPCCGLGVVRYCESSKDASVIHTLRHVWGPQVLWKEGRGEMNTQRLWLPGGKIG